MTDYWYTFLPHVPITVALSTWLLQNAIDGMEGPSVAFLIVLIKDSIGGFESDGYIQQLDNKNCAVASKENEVGPMVIRWIVYSIVIIIFLLDLDDQRSKPATEQEVVAANRPYVWLKESNRPTVSYLIWSKWGWQYSELGKILCSMVYYIGSLRLYLVYCIIDQYCIINQCSIQ